MCGKEISIEYKHCDKCSRKLNGIKARKVERPLPLELAHLIKTYGFINVGKMFGVSDKAIVGWCKAYDMPTHKKEIKSWLDQQTHVENNIFDENNKCE